MCKRPQNLCLLLSFVLTLAVPASQAASFWEEDVWNSDDRGVSLLSARRIKEESPGS